MTIFFYCGIIIETTSKIQGESYMLDALLQYENPGISIFGFKIYAYAIIIVCGMIAAFFVISLLFKRRNMSSDLFLTYFCVTLPVALITTRLFYCITDGLPLKDWFSMESIREGGLSIIGGILGGTISVLAVSYFKKVNFFRAADCIVVGLLLAQAIGRWGNFANQEVYGAEVTNEALQFFPFAVYINKTDGGSCLQTFVLTFEKIFGGNSDISGGTWHYAFFFYESFINLVVAILLFVHAWKNPKKPNGLNVAFYFINYGLVRSIMEPLRDPSYILGDKVQWSFVFSLLMLFAGIALLLVLLFLATRVPYGITDYIKDNKKEVAYLTKINMMCKIFPENYVKPAPEKEEETEENDEEQELGENYGIGGNGGDNESPENHSIGENGKKDGKGADEE